MDREEGEEVEGIALRTKVLRWRLGAAVARCHVLPHMGSYTVGGHSHNALSLLYALYPGEPPAKLVRAVHFHDIAEGQIGDVPAHVQASRPRIAEALQAAQRAADSVLGLNFLHRLTAEEHEWLRAVDLLELWLWGCDQLAAGNTHVREMMRRLEAWMEQIDLPEPVRAFWQAFEWEIPPSVWEEGEGI